MKGGGEAGKAPPGQAYFFLNQRFKKINFPPPHTQEAK